MAIQINGTTVIDDSRNLTNVSIATNLCNAGNFEGASNTVTLCGNTFDYVRIRSQQDMTVCICNAPCGKPMFFDVGSNFNSTYCFKDINSNALAKSVTLTASTATAVQLTKNSNFCNFCALIVNSTCNYASIPTATSQCTDFVRGNIANLNTATGLCTFRAGINTGQYIGLCYLSVNCACPSFISGTRCNITCPGAPHRTFSMLLKSDVGTVALNFSSVLPYSICNFREDSSFVFFCPNNVICESGGYFYCYNLSYFGCVCGYGFCCGCKVFGTHFYDPDLDILWAAVNEPGNPNGCPSCGSWRGFNISSARECCISCNILISASYQVTGLGVGGFVLDPIHASKSGTEPFFFWSGCGFGRAYKSGNSACPLCFSNICCGPITQNGNYASYRIKSNDIYIIQCSQESTLARFIRIKDLRGLTWCCDFTVNQAWCEMGFYATSGGCWDSAVSSAVASFGPCVSPTGRWAAFPVWGGGPVGGYTFGNMIFETCSNKYYLIGSCNCPHIEWGIDECCIITAYTTNNACGCFGYRYCLCNAACEACGHAWFHQMNCADYQYYNNVCTCIPGCTNITMCIASCGLGKGTCLCTTMPIDSASYRLFPGKDLTTRKISRNNLFTSYNVACTFNS